MQTSSLSGASRAAFFDELEKIAEAVEPDRAAKLKRWARNAALVATGAGLGGAITTVGDRLMAESVFPALAQMSPAKRKLIAGSIGGLASIGAVMAAQRLAKAKGEDHE